MRLCVRTHINTSCLLLKFHNGYFYSLQFFLLPKQEYKFVEKLFGRKVVVVANLKPRMMRGLESNGMICAASLENSDDTPAIATFLESVKIGARLK